MPDTEIVNASTGEIVPVNLFGGQATDVIERASAVAKGLAEVIRDRKLFSPIEGRNYVRVEGWTLLGSMLGVFPVCVWTKQVEGGWEARVEARTINGIVVGAAEAQCTRTESTWAQRDDYALRSMAQTRATSKALRQPLGFVVAMAGYETTPSEEVPHEGFQDRNDSPHGVCSTHNVPYMMKGRMTSPAHPMQNGGWCNKQAKDETDTEDLRDEVDTLLDELTTTKAERSALVAQVMPSLANKRPAQMTVAEWTSLLTALRARVVKPTPAPGTDDAQGDEPWEEPKK